MKAADPNSRIWRYGAGSFTTASLTLRDRYLAWRRAHSRPIVLYWRSLFATVRWRRYRTEFSVVCRSSGECVAKFISRGLARSAVLRVQSCFRDGMSPTSQGPGSYTTVLDVTWPCLVGPELERLRRGRFPRPFGTERAHMRVNPGGALAGLSGVRPAWSALPGSILNRTLHCLPSHQAAAKADRSDSMALASPTHLPSA
jgi:hypothetical protein